MERTIQQRVSDSRLAVYPVDMQYVKVCVAENEVENGQQSIYR